MKFTPGPYSVFADDKGISVCTIDGAKRLARLTHADGRGLGNAHLFMAAPDMLDDLVEAERMFRWYGDLHAAKPDPEKAARNFEMADRLAGTIAKARGEA